MKTIPSEVIREAWIKGSLAVRESEDWHARLADPNYQRPNRKPPETLFNKHHEKGLREALKVIRAWERKAGAK